MCREADAIVVRAKELDQKGKRRNWYTAGGPERP